MSSEEKKIRVATALLHKSSFKSRSYQKVNIEGLLLTSPNSLYLSSLVISKFPVIYFHTENWDFFFTLQVSGREEESKPMLTCRIYTTAGTENASHHQTKQSQFKLLLSHNLWRGDRKIYWGKCWWPVQSLNIFVARTMTNCS